MAETNGDDRRESAFGEFAQSLLTLAVILDLEILIGDAGVGLEFLGTVNAPSLKDLSLRPPRS
jgi:hypothetical protein